MQLLIFKITCLSFILPDVFSVSKSEGFSDSYPIPAVASIASLCSLSTSFSWKKEGMRQSAHISQVSLSNLQVQACILTSHFQTPFSLTVKDNSCCTECSFCFYWLVDDIFQQCSSFPGVSHQVISPSFHVWQSSLLWHCPMSSRVATSTLKCLVACQFSVSFMYLEIMLVLLQPVSSEANTNISI